MDSGLYKDKPELGILVLPVPLQVLPDGDGLLNEEVHVLREIGSQSLGLQDPKDLVASDETNLERKCD